MIAEDFGYTRISISGLTWGESECRSSIKTGLDRKGIMASVTLYYAPHTRAARVAFLLEELGVPYEREVMDLAAGQHRQAAYLAVHPHGFVPALRDGDTVIYETAAICLYLADRYPERGLAPQPGAPERAAYYQWIVYAVATLEPALADIFLEGQKPVGERDEARVREARERFARSAAVLERALEAPFLVAGRFGVADVLIGSMLVWGGAMGLLEAHPRLAAYASRISARPAFGKS